MAWRIHSSISRGELDFRIKGRVTGTLWPTGGAPPIRLELLGLPHPDLAGLLLRFNNPAANAPLPDGFAPLQSGTIGDMTASHKIRTPDCPPHELTDRLREDLPVHWRLANALHLEWFSDANGRVVLESSDCLSEIDGPATWRLEESDKETLRHTSDQAMAARLAARMEQLDEDEAAERFEDIYEEEREKLRKEWGEPEPEPLTPEEQAAQDLWIEEMNRISEEVEQEIANGVPFPESRDHPLGIECRELALGIHKTIRLSGWIPRDSTAEHPLHELSALTHIAAAKLAGALNHWYDQDCWPPKSHGIGDSLVRLKKARNALTEALDNLDAADNAQLAPADWLLSIRQSLQRILDQVLALIQDLRDHLQQNGDDSSP